MGLKSLLAEIVGISQDDTHPADSLDAFAGVARVLVVFDDSRGDALVQDKQLSLDALRRLQILVAHVLVNGTVEIGKRPTHISGLQLRSELTGPPVGEFGAVLIDLDGAIILRVNEPVSTSDLAHVVGTASTS
jgi:hypothetical protein